MLCFGTKLPSGSMSSIPWRSAGIKYTNNEMFIDLVEEVDAILDKHGNVLVADVKGEVVCNSKLSGEQCLMGRYGREGSGTD
ncbi:hypothetical protein HK097_000799 [Rhizophlyctis rosea]|uniref:MHD domain-containing protein n=1 Tax=Rhizophlyctis rosea TaxID=64517 RepID=A0AAD5S7G4_9FUNG|nr:hypothetical protein HK097_000799 [Rhizophlyctis rosea]